MPGAVAEANRVVEAFAGDIDAVIVGEQAEVDEWIGLLEIAQARDQPADGKRADSAYGQHFARAAIAELFQD